MRFTVARAESLLPELERLLRAAMQVKTELAIANRGLDEFSGRVSMLGGMRVNLASVAGLHTARDSAAARLRNALEGVQASGALLQDLDAGLLDFPSWCDGEEVYLCWKVGEAHIGFWHAVEDGFAGRRRIDDAFLRRHSAGPAD